MDHLFGRIDHHLQGESPNDSLCVVLLLLEAADVLSRIDVKRELIKELERQQTKLMQVADAPGVNTRKLDELLKHQAKLVDQLHQFTGQPGAHLKNNELLNAIRQRASIPGALCEFDIAPLHYWLGLDSSERRDDILGWMEPLTPIREANELVIELIRTSVTPMRVTAESGFLQQSTDAGAPFQMLRVILDDDLDLYPEISAGKHRFSVRFMRLDRSNGHPHQIQDDVTFELALCQL